MHRRRCGRSVAIHVSAMSNCETSFAPDRPLAGSSAIQRLGFIVPRIRFRVPFCGQSRSQWPNRLGEQVPIETFSFLAAVPPSFARLMPPGRIAIRVSASGMSGQAPRHGANDPNGPVAFPHSSQGWGVVGEQHREQGLYHSASTSSVLRSALATSRNNVGLVTSGPSPGR